MAQVRLSPAAQASLAPFNPIQIVYAKRLGQRIPCIEVDRMVLTQWAPEYVVDWDLQACMYNEPMPLNVHFILLEDYHIIRARILRLYPNRGIQPVVIGGILINIKVV